MALRKARFHQDGESVRIISRESGEVIGNVSEDRYGAAVYVPYTPRFKENWIVLFQRALLSMAQDDWNGTEAKVFFAYLGMSDYENQVRITQKEIAEIVGIRPPHVSKAVKALEAKGYLEQRGPIMYITDTKGWKGRIARHNALQKQKVG